MQITISTKIKCIFLPVMLALALAPLQACDGSVDESKILQKVELALRVLEAGVDVAVTSMQGSDTPGREAFRNAVRDGVRVIAKALCMCNDLQVAEMFNLTGGVTDFELNVDFLLLQAYDIVHLGSHLFTALTEMKSDHKASSNFKQSLDDEKAQVSDYLLALSAGGAGIFGAFKTHPLDESIQRQWAHNIYVLSRVLREASNHSNDTRYLLGLGLIALNNLYSCHQTWAGTNTRDGDFGLQLRTQLDSDSTNARKNRVVERLVDLMQKYKPADFKQEVVDKGYGQKLFEHALSVRDIELAKLCKAAGLSMDDATKVYLLDCIIDELQEGGEDPWIELLDIVDEQTHCLQENIIKLVIERKNPVTLFCLFEQGNTGQEHKQRIAQCCVAELPRHCTKMLEKDLTSPDFKKHLQDAYKKMEENKDSKLAHDDYKKLRSLLFPELSPEPDKGNKGDKKTKDGSGKDGAQEDDEPKDTNPALTEQKKKLCTLAQDGRLLAINNWEKTVEALEGDVDIKLDVNFFRHCAPKQLCIDWYGHFSRGIRNSSIPQMKMLFDRDLSPFALVGRSDGSCHVSWDMAKKMLVDGDENPENIQFLQDILKNKAFGDEWVMQGMSRGFTDMRKYNPVELALAEKKPLFAKILVEHFVRQGIFELPVYAGYSDKTSANLITSKKSIADYIKEIVKAGVSEQVCGELENLARQCEDKPCRLAKRYAYKIVQSQLFDEEDAGEVVKIINENKIKGLNNWCLKQISGDVYWKMWPARFKKWVQAANVAQMRTLFDAGIAPVGNFKENDDLAVLSFQSKQAVVHTWHMIAQLVRRCEVTEESARLMTDIFNCQQWDELMNKQEDGLIFLTGSTKSGLDDKKTYNLLQLAMLNNKLQFAELIKTELEKRGVTKLKDYSVQGYPEKPLAQYFKNGDSEG
ncbi:MAG: hypothetical protein H6679_03295 [Epsilonproteobacteria bacterium]|nr:hypothetical protein [Campylobacterota bacterium]